MRTTELELEATDGHPLSATLREPRGVRKGVVQIQGGVGIAQSFYAALASFLVEHQYAVLTFDYRGIGRSKPERLKGYDATIIDWGEKDMTSVFDWLIARFPDDKKIVLGHSIGGQMVGLMRNSDQIDQLIFVSASTGYWKNMSSPAKWGAAFAWYGYVPIVVSLLGYANSRQIRWGEDLPKGVALQWRRWCVHDNYFESDAALMDLSRFKQLSTRLYCIYCADDPVANDLTVSNLLEHYPHTKVNLRKVYPHEVGLKKIGHSGYFQEECRSLWEELLETID